MLLVLFLFPFSKSWGQSIWNNPITGTNPNTANPYTTGQTVDPSISVSGIGRGTGITGTAANDRYNASGWNSGSFDANDYFEFTLNPCVGGFIDFISFVYTGQVSTAGNPNSVSFRSSLDAFTANIGTPNTGGTTISLSGAAYQGVTSPITFRLYGWGAGASGNTWSINSFTFNGTASCSPPCTAPTTTISPTTQTICAGSVASISVTSSATSPSYTWQASANGTSGWATVVNGTPSGASYSGTNTAVLTLTAGSIYYYRCLVAEGGTCTATSSTSTLVVNTISITSQPISVTTTSTGTASYSVTVSGSGLSYQWQQSTGGAFTNISNGGTNPTYAGATSSVLAISNPPLSMSGYSYQCVVSNACGTVTTNGTSTLTVNSFVCPFLVSAVVNSCDGCADEGNNEMVVMNSGSYNIPVSSGSLSVIYNNGSDNNFSSSFAATATSTNIAVGDAVSQLNTLAGCSNTFSFVPSGGTIPANSNFIILNKNSCFTGDFSPYCGQGPIYVVISTAAVWSPTGFFGNNNSTRWFKTDFSYLNASCGITTYSYNTTNSFGFSTDGASVTFNGTTPSYIEGNGTCVPPLAILPIELIDFYATQDGAKNNLVWKVASENNILQYIIEKSEDGINFIELARVNANNIEGLYQFYSSEDNSPYSNLTYYRLSTIENNHQIYGHKIIAIDRADKDWKSLLYQNNDELILEFKNAMPKNAQLLLFDLSGKLLCETLIEQSSTRVNTTKIAAGIYFGKVETPYKTENFKIIIRKDR